LASAAIVFYAVGGGTVSIGGLGGVTGTATQTQPTPGIYASTQACDGGAALDGG